jgi:sulfate adenylyltransferase subunit 2
MTLTHLDRLEAESLHILREVAAEFQRPVMLYSIGKDSSVLLHLLRKAFRIRRRRRFRCCMSTPPGSSATCIALPRRLPERYGLELRVHINRTACATGVSPMTHGSDSAHPHHEDPGAEAGAGCRTLRRRHRRRAPRRRASRAKERVFSFRSEGIAGIRRQQRPEPWNLYNTRIAPGESVRAFPLSNWTELDIWLYILRERIGAAAVLRGAERPVVERDGTLIMVDDERLPLLPGETPQLRRIRFRTLGCYPLSGGFESEADTLEDIIAEMLQARSSERQGRLIDGDAGASMEQKKQEGYF